MRFRTRLLLFLLPAWWLCLLGLWLVARTVLVESQPALGLRPSLWTLNAAFLAAALVGGLIAVAAVVWLVHRLRAPISVLTEEARQLATGGAGEGLARRPLSEVADLHVALRRAGDELGVRMRALTAAEERLRLAVQAGGLGIWEWSIADDRLFWDERVHALHGTDPGAFAPTPAAAAALVHPEDREALAAAQRLALATGDELQHEYRIVRADGGVRHLRSHALVRREERGQRMVGVVSDITAARSAHEAMHTALLAAEAATTAKSDFLATMSHEIRTPMNGVIGMTELLLDTGLNAEQRDMVQTIHTAGSGLLELINDILDYTKVESGRLDLERQPFDPAALARAAVALFAPQAASRGLALRLDIAAEAPTCLIGDQHRVRQLLLNLVGNAIKFTERGSVTVRVGRRGTDRAAILEVADTGIGIPPEHLPRLFQRFSQVDNSRARRHGGTGLGLAICKRLAEAMGGSIGVDSEPGRGSTFRVVLPLPERAGLPPPPPTPSTESYVRSQRLRLLLAEDNPMNRRVAVAMLEHLGHTVETAADGQEAVAAFRRGAFALVVMDMAMPVMDGLAATRAIRAAEAELGLPRTPVVALTANAGAADREACLAAGMDDVLAKPIATAELAAAIGRLVGKGAPPGP
jgi:PAS domain S-box-containing protein